MNSFYTHKELESIGFKKFGSNVQISKKCSIYNAKNIEIGSNVRIDDFCILSGNITIGNYVHIAAFCGLFAGEKGIEINDFVGISSRTVIYANSDDYTNGYFTNPTIPLNFRNINSARVILEKHTIVGTGSTLLPGVILKEGTSIGAMSLVNKNTNEWTVNIGIPIKEYKKRKKINESIEKKLLNQL